MMAAVTKFSPDALSAWSSNVRSRNRPCLCAKTAWGWGRQRYFNRSSLEEGWTWPTVRLFRSRLALLGALGVPSSLDELGKLIDWVGEAERNDQPSLTIVFSITPTSDTSTRTTSPTLSRPLVAAPTPDGVPVDRMSPGSRVITCDR